MSLFTPRTEYYSKPPMSNNDDRDENFLIDVLGIWVPECELVFYGLLSDLKYRDELYKLRNFTQAKPRDTYLDLSFFQSRDLVRYLASPNDDYEDLDETYIQEAIQTALERYLYAPCSETSMRHAIMELMYQRNIKSVTLVYPWDPRPLDMNYLRKITPKTILPKLNITGGTIPEVIQATPVVYTTIITNELDTVRLLTKEPETYRTQSTLFLLRNHSGNMDVTKVPDTTRAVGYRLNFTECDTSDILLRMVNPKTGMPINRMRFGRFEPNLFSDLENRMRPFRNN